MKLEAALLISFPFHPVSDDIRTLSYAKGIDQTRSMMEYIDIKKIKEYVLDAFASAINTGMQIAEFIANKLNTKDTPCKYFAQCLKSEHDGAYIDTIIITCISEYNEIDPYYFA